jgi:hypothetical protein
MDRRLKIYREHNPNEQAVHDLFAKFIGKENVKVTTCFGEDVLNNLQTFIERNGKPCCINLITEKDIKFLKNIEKKKAEFPIGEEQKAGDA